MKKSLSAAAASIAFIAMFGAPLSALAYLSPDQVFGGTDLKSAAPDAPTEQVTKRSAEQVIQDQQARAAEARKAAQDSLVPVDAIPVDTYTAPVQTRDILSDEAQFQNRQKRIQEKAGSSPTIIVTGDGDVLDANGNVLHSGAPRVAGTGPETVLAFIAIALAMLCTFAYVQLRSRMMLSR